MTLESFIIRYQQRELIHNPFRYPTQPDRSLRYHALEHPWPWTEPKGFPLPFDEFGVSDTVTGFKTAGV